MATYNLRRFSNPETLKAISPAALLKLLSPQKKFFSNRGIKLPDSASADGWDYEGLAKVFMDPDDDTPSDFAETLYLIHEMATHENANELLHELDARNIKLDIVAESTPADIAIQVWLNHPDLLERKHAEQFLLHHRSFEYFQTDRRPIPEFKSPDKSQIEALENDLNDWFESKKRGRGARVFFFQKEDGVWFLVRHGDLFKREGSLNAGKSETVFYRPERYDVLGYDSAEGELRIHAGSQKEKELYRKRFGFHVFGDENFFPGDEKYTLEPLRADGESSLACDDIPGLEWVRLREIRFLWGGPQGEQEIRKADDLFAVWKARERGIHEKARIIRASLLVKFENSKVPRTVVIRPSNIAQYKRDGDGPLLEKFLKARKFILEKSDERERVDEQRADLARV